MTQVTTGSFTNVASTPFFIALEQQVSKFEIINLSKLASYTSGRVTNAVWYNYMANGTAIVDAPTTNTVTGSVIRTQLAQSGISYYNPTLQANGPNISGASFVPGQPTVFTAAAHGFQVGDNLRIVNLPTAPQLGGLTMTVTAASTNTFTTLLDSTNALTSTFTVYKVGNVNLPSRNLYYPENRVISKITQANPMVVTTLVAQNYQVGDVVRFAIPSVYGMQQLNTGNNGLPLEFTVSAVNNAVGTQTVTFSNVNSSSYTAFVSLAAVNYPSSLPQMIPQGEGNTNSLVGVTPNPLPYGNQNILGFARQNQGYAGILIGAGDGTAAASTGGLIGSTTDTWVWTATTALQQFPQI